MRCLRSSFRVQSALGVDITHSNNKHSNQYFMTVSRIVSFGFGFGYFVDRVAYTTKKKGPSKLTVFVHLCRWNGTTVAKTKRRHVPYFSFIH